LSDGTKDGFYLNRKCFGTYIHGILDNGVFIDFLLEPYTEKSADKPFDLNAYKEEQYNKLADHVRGHVNMALVYEMLTRP
jgi:adenosylcobyric acid synthase